MFKKALLSTLIVASTIATAHINLNLDLTIKNEINEHNATGTVTIEENITASIMFDGLDALVVDINAQTDGENVTLQTQFFQKIDTDELLTISELFTVQVPFDQPATITLHETDSDGSLVLSIIPTTAE